MHQRTLDLVKQKIRGKRTQLLGYVRRLVQVRLTADRFRSFDEFWPFYLREHTRPATRAVHVAGTWIAALVLLVGMSIGPWWLVLLALVIGHCQVVGLIDAFDRAL
jgi:hypothetical protein